MKIVLDIKVDKDLEKDDIIVYDKGWKVMSKSSFIGELSKDYNQKHNNNKERIEKLEKDLVTLAKIVKEK